MTSDLTFRRSHHLPFSLHFKRKEKSLLKFCHQLEYMKSFESNLLFSTLARARLPEAFCKGVVVDFQLRDLRQIFVKSQIGYTENIGSLM